MLAAPRRENEGSALSGRRLQMRRLSPRSRPRPTRRPINSSSFEAGLSYRTKRRGGRGHRKVKSEGKAKGEQQASDPSGLEMMTMFARDVVGGGSSGMACPCPRVFACTNAETFRPGGKRRTSTRTTSGGQTTRGSEVKLLRVVRRSCPLPSPLRGI